MRLVTTLGVTLLLAEDTIALGAAMAIGLLLFALYGVSLEFISSNPRACLTVRLCGDLENFQNHIDLIASSNNYNPI